MTLLNSGSRRRALHGRLRDTVFDAAIIGGGIYGVLLALEGAARGQRVVLLERDDFGGGTSFNSLRTIHGGLRYLQFLDVPRALVSSAQRRWWLRTFPDLVQPISCLMPLHGEGLRRPTAFRAAFLLARLLGLGRDAQGRPGRAGIVPAAEALRAAPVLREASLQAAAVWQDAFMPHSQRIIVECLRWAESAGAVLANRTEFRAAAPGAAGQTEWRITATDRLTESDQVIAARILINAAGPAVDDVAARITGGAAAPILVPTLAWNLLIDKPPVSDYSIAAKPPGAGRRTYFIHPFHGRMLVGTGHSALAHAPDGIRGVPEASVDGMIDDLNEALPGIGLTRRAVEHIFWGILPGVKAGSDALLMRPIIVDHGSAHGSARAWSVLGVKFTEAPFVAERVWNAVLGRRREPLPARPQTRRSVAVSRLRELSDPELWQFVQELFETEWCDGLDDVILRRTDLWMHPRLSNRISGLAERRDVGVGSGS
jgi:glycerol-3-phosphate dehydrogenase